MAVLAAERTAEEPLQPAPPLPPSAAGTAPRPDAAAARRQPARLAARGRPGPVHAAQPALGHRLPARPALRRGVLPARGARAADLGLRVQPRLLLHRPSAAGQVADRLRADPLRLRRGGLALPVGGRRVGGRRRSWSRLARRLTGSTLLGLLAGLLLALDGFSFTLSRIGLLDVFLQVFVLGAVACLVVDRDRVRERIRDQLPVPVGGFRLGPRGWRIAAGCSSARPARSSGAASGSSRSSPSCRCSGSARPGATPASRGPPGRRCAADCPEPSGRWPPCRC